MEIKAIGTIHSRFTEAKGTPIQTALAADAEGWIELSAEFVPALRDLDGFERIWLLYWFDRCAEVSLEVIPYLDQVSRGLFATRAPCRPNPIGLSAVRLIGVEKNILRIADVDILDGTPLLDIKPYAPRFDHFAARRCGWLDQVNIANGIRADNRFSGNQRK